MTRRVVITGMGAVTPIGNNVEESWAAAKKGVNGIDEITFFDTTEHKAKLAGECRNFNPDDHFEKREAKRLDRYAQLGLVAAKEAMQNAGLVDADFDHERAGVIVGSGIGGIDSLMEGQEKLNKFGPRKVSPMVIPMLISNLLAGNIAIAYGFKGHCSCVVTACSTGNNAIGDAFDLIRFGKQDIMIAGGSEAPIVEIAVAGFANMTALSQSEDKDRASIPFDKERNGFVMGEGAGIVVLEEYEAAKARGANILGEIVGYGSTCDAYHITSPDPEGEGAVRAMKMALELQKVDPALVGYVNAHGTSTPLNDAMETKAIKKVFDKNTISVSSTKSMTGHLLGAAGAVEAIFTLKALQEGFLPPTIGYKEADEQCDLDIVPNVGKQKDLEYALSNSFGFGGHNVSILFKKF